MRFFVCKRGGFWMEFGEDVLAGMRAFGTGRLVVRSVMPYFYRDGCGGDDASMQRTKSAV